VVLDRVKTAVRIVRAPFFTAVIVPALAGAAVAWQEGTLHGGYLVLTVLGIVCVNAGLNMSNDYFDHLSGNDEQNQNLTPFSGGSRVIQDGTLTPRAVVAGSVAFYALGAAIGLYLAWARGWELLWIGALGVFIGIFHNAPPFQLYYLAPGAGELAAGIGCGPLIVLGSYFVQTQQLSGRALWASIPLGLLTAAVLYINEFPDFLADRAVGKKTIVVVLGRKRAVWGYAALLFATYLTIIVGVVVGAMPYPLLLSLLTVPLAFRAVRGAFEFYDQVQELIPTNALTIQLHLTTGLLMCIGYVVAAFL
jgi:1,4-dihydroxy-2-naphthoate octaprenyltransferase